MSKNLYQHLSEVMAIAGYVQKDSRNDFHKYRYASADKVLSKVREELSQRGIAIVRDVENSKIVYVDETAKNVIYQWAGDLVLGPDRAEIVGMGQGSDKGDKAVMKAQTAALKYALAGTFLISWGDDPEADRSTDEPAKEEKITTEQTKEILSLLKGVSGKNADSIREKMKKGLSCEKAQGLIDWMKVNTKMAEMAE